MANTSALRAKILRQIRALEADLRAIERVEQIASQQGEEGSQNGRATLIGTIERLLDDEWTPVSVYLGRVQAIHTGAKRTAVSTALQRLTDRGVAEARGERKTGYDYRRKKVEP